MEKLERELATVLNRIRVNKYMWQMSTINCYAEICKLCPSSNLQLKLVSQLNVNFSWQRNVVFTI